MCSRDFQGLDLCLIDASLFHHDPRITEQSLNAGMDSNSQRAATTAFAPELHNNSQRTSELCDDNRNAPQLSFDSPTIDPQLFNAPLDLQLFGPAAQSHNTNTMARGAQNFDMSLNYSTPSLSTGGTAGAMSFNSQVLDLDLTYQESKLFNNGNIGATRESYAFSPRSISQQPALTHPQNYGIYALDDGSISVESSAKACSTVTNGDYQQGQMHQGDYQPDYDPQSADPVYSGETEQGEVYHHQHLRNHNFQSSTPAYDGASQKSQMPQYNYQPSYDFQSSGSINHETTQHNNSSYRYLTTNAFQSTAPANGAAHQHSSMSQHTHRAYTTIQSNGSQQELAMPINAAPVQKSGISQAPVRPNSGVARTIRKARSIQRSLITPSGAKLRTRYTEAEEREFWQLVHVGQKDHVIAAELGKTAQAVTTKRKRKQGIYADAHASCKVKKTQHGGASR